MYFSSSRRIASQEVSLDWLLFWVGALIHEAEQERNKKKVMHVTASPFKSNERAGREQLDIQLRETEIERIMSATRRVKSSRPKPKRSAGRSGGGGGKGRQRGKDGWEIAKTVAQILRIVISAVLAVTTFFITLPHKTAQELGGPPGWVQPRDEDPYWIRLILGFLRPLALRLES